MESKLVISQAETQQHAVTVSQMDARSRKQLAAAQAATEKRLATAESELAVSRIENQQHFTTIADLRKQLANWRFAETMPDLQNCLATFQTESRQHSTEIAGLREQLACAHAANEASTKDQSEIIEDLQKCLATAESELGASRKERQLHSTTINYLRRQLAGAQAVNKAESELAESQQHPTTISDLLNQLAAMEAETQLQAITVSDLRKQLVVVQAAAEKRLATKESDLAASRKETQQHSTTIADLRKQLAGANEAIANDQSNTLEDTKTILDLRKRLATAELELVQHASKTAPSDQLERLVKDLQNKLEEARLASTMHFPWIGFEMNPSAIVKHVQLGSPADECGIVVGDKCTMVGGKPVTSLDTFRAIVKGNLHPGMTVPLRLQRGKATKDVFLTVRCISMKPKGS